MEVSVERYTRKKYMGQADSPTLYYLRPKTGSARILSTREVPDKEIKQVNASHLATRSPYAVDFALYSKNSATPGGGDEGEIIDSTA